MSGSRHSFHIRLFIPPRAGQRSRHKRPGYAGITPGKAREKAKGALEQKPPTAELKVSAQSKGTVDGWSAWYVYFVSTKDATFSGCVVTVSKNLSVVADNCGG